MLGDDDELCVEGSAEWERNSGGWGSVGVSVQRAVLSSSDILREVFESG